MAGKLGGTESSRLPYPVRVEKHDLPKSESVQEGIHVEELENHKYSHFPLFIFILWLARAICRDCCGPDLLGRLHRCWFGAGMKMPCVRCLLYQKWSHGWQREAAEAPACVFECILSSRL